MKFSSKKIHNKLIIIALLFVTIGYATLNSTINITGKSNISKNTWDIHFDNIQIKEGSAGEVKTPTIENKTTVDFEVNLNLPGDFYEFTVEVVNAGSIDAMINNIEKTPVLTEEQAKYLNYTITYENNENITTKQLVKKEEYVRLKVRVEYKKDLVSSDLPQNTETLNLIFTVNYIQADETAISVKDNGEKKLISSNGDINEIGTIVTIGDQQFYTIGTEGDNVKLLSMYNLYVGATNDSTTNTLTTYGSEATGLQDENMLGYRSNSTIHKGLTAFSSNTQKGENYNDYTGSIVEIYVNNYKNELEKMGINIVQARLITKDELISEKIGCSGSSCSNAPSWVYSSSYWTSSPSGTTDIWGMYGSSYFSIVYSYNKYFGVRPVIVISKSNF